MDGLSKWMIWGYHYFRKHPYMIHMYLLMYQLGVPKTPLVSNYDEAHLKAILVEVPNFILRQTHLGSNIR